MAEHQRAVWAAAYSSLGDPALSEDIAQEAFLVAWRKLPELGERPKLPAWFCGIARNLARNARRIPRGLDAGDGLEAIADESASALDALLGAEEEQAVWQALEQLPDTLREPLVLFYSCDKSVREVAAALDISETAARQRLSRGRSQLDERLQELVAGGLKRAAPGTAFTAAVVAALATTSSTVEAATTSATSSTLPLWLGGGALVAAAGLALTVFSPQPPSSSAQAAPAAVVASLSTTAEVLAPPARAATASTAPRWFRPRTPSVPPPAAKALPPDDDSISAELHALLSRKIDIELRQASVHDVLRLLGEAGNVDIVIEGDIASDVTFHLRAATVMEGIDAALEQAGAVWREVPEVRVVESDARPGIPVPGKPVTLELSEAELDDVLGSLSGVLGIPVVLGEGVTAPPVSVRLVALPADRALEEVIASAGLGYEIVPAILVRPEEDVFDSP